MALGIGQRLFQREIGEKMVVLLLVVYGVLSMLFLFGPAMIVSVLDREWRKREPTRNTVLGALGGATIVAAICYLLITDFGVEALCVAGSFIAGLIFEIKKPHYRRLGALVVMFCAAISIMILQTAAPYGTVNTGSAHYELAEIKEGYLVREFEYQNGDREFAFDLLDDKGEKVSFYCDNSELEVVLNDPSADEYVEAEIWLSSKIDPISGKPLHTIRKEQKKTEIVPVKLQVNQSDVLVVGAK